MTLRRLAAPPAMLFMVVGLGFLGCKKQPAVDMAQVERGKAVFEEQCALCHDSASTERKVGPGLKGLFQRQKMEDGKPINETTVRENIEKGSQNMPSFKDTLSPQDKDAVIAFLKTL